MYRCFVEYKVVEEARAAYLADLRLAMQHYPNVYIYEGTDQPGLFVEVWAAPTKEEADRAREERLAAHSPWAAVSRHAAGNVHAWVFRPLEG